MTPSLKNAGHDLVLCEAQPEARLPPVFSLILMVSCTQKYIFLKTSFYILKRLGNDWPHSIQIFRGDGSLGIIMSIYIF